MPFEKPEYLTVGANEKLSNLKSSPLGLIVGPASDVSFEVVSDVPWFWNLFFARRILYGHCILAGDSFHSWPPFGGIGGNTGYGDASNLGWKLAAMCKGWGHEGMLISYDIERRQFGLKIIMIVLNFAPDR